MLISSALVLWIDVLRAVLVLLAVGSGILRHDHVHETHEHEDSHSGGENYCENFSLGPLVHALGRVVHEPTLSRLSLCLSMSFGCNLLQQNWYIISQLSILCNMNN
jgi:hypothetical protein